MRHYMVDPDNAERLLKIPPSVVAEIQADALREALEAVAAINWQGSFDDRFVIYYDDVLATINELLEDTHITKEGGQA